MPQLQMLTVVMLALAVSVLVLHEWICRSANFRPDSIDTRTTGTRTVPSPDQSLRDSSSRGAPQAHSVTSEAPMANEQRALPPRERSPAALESKWTANGGPAYVMHARHGPGVVMQVMDGRSVCVRQEDDEPCSIDDCGDAAAALDARATAGMGSSGRGSGAGGLGKWPAGPDNRVPVAARGRYPMGNGAGGAATRRPESSSVHARTAGHARGSQRDARRAGRPKAASNADGQKARSSTSLMDALKCVRLVACAVNVCLLARSCHCQRRGCR